MDLKDFIKNTVSSISEAIKESQEDLKEDGVIINPEKMEIGKTGEKLLRSDGWRYVQNLDFDIMVGVEDKEGTKGGGQLKVAGIVSIGGSLSDESHTQNQNRIKFTIPVAFSTSSTPNEYRKRKPGIRVNP